VIRPTIEIWDRSTVSQMCKAEAPDRSANSSPPSHQTDIVVNGFVFLIFQDRGVVSERSASAIRWQPLETANHQSPRETGGNVS